LLPISKKVPGSNLNWNGADGCRSSVEGAEKLPKNGSCVDNGMRITGAGFLDITNVEFKLTDPDWSLAVSSKSTTVIVPAPISLIVGIPENVRVLLFRKSQLGASDRV
jgi:hypothetical protein